MHTDFIDRYIAIWHEPDAARRRQLVAALWTEDAAHFTRNIAVHGHDEITARVGRAYTEFVGSGGYRFRPRGPAEEHHAGVRFAWEMVPAAGGAAAGAGTTFLALADDGRIRLEYQFSDPSPA
ncbi:MAG TPA: hypothetical protein VGR62_03535 [Candidatus Binatia bacterium]|nr:hypothetical protein [Candidatus Binatia bacterium]